MDVIAHDAPGMQYEAFVLLAKPKAIDEDVAVGLTGKHIHPFYHGKGDEVDRLLVPDFIAADAHAGFGYTLNLLFLIRKSNTPLLPGTTVCSSGLLAVVCNDGPNHQLSLIWKNVVITDGLESQTKASRL